MQVVIILIDCDNFYVSCERIFNLSLHGVPVVVLSNNDGCIISRSQEAKQLGIRMGVPLFQVRQIIDANNVRVYSSNYALYADISQRVMSVLEEFTPEVEKYSIDEAFMNAAGINPKRWNCATYRDLGVLIRNNILKRTGIPVTVGIARTKTLAKVATHLAKKSEKAAGVLDLTDSPHLNLALERTPVEEVWGIGPAKTRKLREAGITNALELRDADTNWVRKAMTVVGARIVMELRGVNCMPLELCPRPRKSVTNSRLFPVVITKLDELREAVATFVSRAAEKLREDKLAASAITVYLSESVHAQGTHSPEEATIELIYPTDSTQELAQHAQEALERIFREGYEYRKAGVELNGLVPASERTGRLFDNETLERFRRVMPIVDMINRKYGRDTVRLARANPRGRWKTKFEHRSPHYTTRLLDILAIK
jgi:DNA polymerase V